MFVAERRTVARDRGFRERLLYAWMRYRNLRGGEATQEWLADLVSRRVKRTPAYDQGTVSRWFSGSVPRDLKTIVAIAEALRVDPGWLAFGPASSAKAPDDDIRDRMRLIPPDAQLAP